MILLQLSLFFFRYDIALFLLGTYNKCAKIKNKKILVKSHDVKKYLLKVATAA